MSRVGVDGFGTLTAGQLPVEGECGGGPDVRVAALHRMVAQLVLETTNEGIWLINSDAQTTYVNRAAAEMLGYPEDDMLGKQIFEFLDEDRIPFARESLVRRRAGTSERLEVRLRRKDGSGVWVIGSTNPVYDRRGEYAGALAVFGDLSLQKEREGHLREEIHRIDAALRQAQAAAGAVRPRGPPLSTGQAALNGAVALAACGTFLATVGMLTLCGAISAVAGMTRGAPEPEGPGL
jgi:PAS domain S-box-containing protein